MLAAPARRRRTRGDRGMVTAETAVVLPVLVLLVAFACWLVATGVAALRCTDAARLGARAAARGDSTTTVMSIAHGAAPGGAVVTLDRTGDTVVVRVRAVVHPAGGWFGRLAAVGVSAAATAPAEDAVPALGGEP